ncbi:MAG: Uma2 family endonuclease, partial [Dethiobacteria bacterium]
TFTLSGVKEFWVVDPKKETVIVYTFNNYEIEEYTLLKGEDTLRSYYFEGLQIPLREIFEQ